MNHILDACAMLAYLRGEAGALVVASSLGDPHVACHAHAINLREVYYDFIRWANERTARQAVAALRANGLRERQDMGRLFWRRVARLKSRGRIFLADCCIALAQKMDGTVLTSDHHEFDPLAPLNLCPISFIR